MKIPPASRSGIRRTWTPCPSSVCATASCARRTTSGGWRLEEGSFLQLGGDHADRASIVEGGRHMIARDETPYDVDAMFRQQGLRPLRRGRRLRTAPARARARIPGLRRQPRRPLPAVVRRRGLLDPRPEERRDAERHRGGSTANSWTSTGRPRANRCPASARRGGWRTTRPCSSTTAGTCGEVRPDGSGGRRLTRGAGVEVRHRVVRLDFEGRRPRPGRAASTIRPTASGPRRPASRAPAGATPSSSSSGRTPPSASSAGSRRPRTPTSTSFARSASTIPPTTS